MTEQPYGRYFAQELVLEDEEARRRIQDALHAGERKKWHLASGCRTSGRDEYFGRGVLDMPGTVR